jgi:hypothetical protein
VVGALHADQGAHQGAFIKENDVTNFLSWNGFFLGGGMASLRGHCVNPLLVLVLRGVERASLRCSDAFKKSDAEQASDKRQREVGQLHKAGVFQIGDGVLTDWKFRVNAEGRCRESEQIKIQSFATLLAKLLASEVGFSCLMGQTI